MTEGTETVLNDGVKAKFTHTLLVTDRRAGLYRCVIANKFSSASAELTVQGGTFHYILKLITIYEIRSLPSI